MISPQQSVFMLCKNTALDIFDGKVYDYLPGKEVAYPFIFIGEQFSNDIENKSVIFANVTQRVHFFHNDFRERRRISDLILKYMQAIREKEEAFKRDFLVKEMSYRMLTDNTTDTPLMHGVLEITFLVN